MDYKYGLFYYRTDNIGDEIQSIAARRFLPQVDYWFDRDNINATKIQSSDHVKIIANGWYTKRPENWPPKNKNLEPLLVSMHINPYSEETLARFGGKESVEFLKKYGPIGARDKTTLDFLIDSGLDAFFSGCMTLTLTADKKIKKKDYILAVDVSDEMYDALAERARTKVLRLDTMHATKLTREEKFALAEYYLYLYQSAKTVVTSRLHCMLPCLALGTPALAVYKKEPERYAGLIELVHNMSEEDYIAGKRRYNINNPPANKDDYKKYRGALIKQCAEFTGCDTKTSFLYGKTPQELLESAALATAVAKGAEAGFKVEQLVDVIEAKDGVIAEKDTIIESLRQEVEYYYQKASNMENLGIKGAAKNVIVASKNFAKRRLNGKTKNYIKINRVWAEGDMVKYDYEIGGTESFKKLFWMGELFTTKYYGGEKYLNSVPKSILIIPFLSNVLPIAWVNDATIFVDELDKTFYECLDGVKNEYRKMLPEAVPLGGRIEAKSVIENVPKEDDREALTFSGGVDSFATMLRYVKNSPDLVTVWGADIDFENEIGWQQVVKQVEKVGQDYGLNNVLVKTAFRRFIDNSELEQQYHDLIGDNWWHAMQHGIGFIGVLAPYAYGCGVGKIYVPSTFRRDENILCASSAGIMEDFKFGKTQCVYDDSLGTRQEKVGFIMGGGATHRDAKLRVCYRSTLGVNCCNCEKCFRTIMQILATGHDPNDYGFNMVDEKYQEIPKTLQNLDFNDRVFWRMIQEELLKNKPRWKDDRRVNWIFKMDFSD